MKGFESDIWSLGILYYKVVTGKFPFGTRSTSRKQLFETILNENVEFPTNVEKIDEIIINGMLEKDPKKRFSLATILSVLQHNL